MIRNLVRKLKEIPRVNAFLEIDENLKCKKHRRQMLELFLRARVYGYFKQRSDEMHCMNSKQNMEQDIIML